MGTVLPMEFVRQGNDIVLRVEQDNSDRLIEMSLEPEDALDGHSLLRRSTDSWDSDSLVVETTNIEANRPDQHGTPHSSAIRLGEQFIPSSDGSRLDYQLTITDRDTFTQSFKAARSWIWRPEIVIGNYACGEEQELR